MHAEQRRARLDLVGRATSDGAAHVLGAIPPQAGTEVLAHEEGGGAPARLAESRARISRGRGGRGRCVKA